jgi:sugar/nucleoside kinase (ribokinase family)
LEYGIKYNVVKPVAGGSGINTATHLASLVQDFPFSIKNKNINNDDINGSGNGNGDASTGENENEQQVEEDIIDDDEQMDVTVQTVVNENDDYGRLLLDHAKQNNFEIINCRRKEATTTTTSSTPQDVSANNNEEEKEQQQITKDTTPSTGHCIVLVTQNERSFITHLGIMKSFQPSHTILHELVHCRSANPTFTNHHHHVHIAGYYNVPKFHSKNALKKRIKLIREKRRTKSHGQSVYTTTISLTPQYDATEKWETTELFNLLPLVDFLILNLIEACHISKVKLPKENEEYGGSALDRSVMFLQLADFFDEQSPQTYVVVTLGKLGAVLLYGGEVVYTHHSPAKYDTPVDATGAGDAFVSGFLYGTMNWRRERQHNQVYEIGSVLEEAGGWNEAIEVGMKWGCVAGTACVMKAGASVPSSKDELLALLHPPVASEDEDGNENGLVRAESGEIGYEDEEESELDSDYVPDEDESSSYYSSSYADGDYFESFSEEGDNEDNKDEKRWL